MAKYVVTELRKEKVEDEFYTKIEHVYDNPQDMIYYADYLADVAEQDMKDGKIVDFQIEY